MAQDQEDAGRPGISPVAQPDPAQGVKILGKPIGGAEVAKPARQVNRQFMLAAGL